MNKEHDVCMETLNVVQQVLKGALASIAVASRANPAEVALLLQAFAKDQQGADSRATAMLLDIAQGFDHLAHRQPN